MLEGFDRVGEQALVNAGEAPAFTLDQRCISALAEAKRQASHLIPFPVDGAEGGIGGRISAMIHEAFLLAMRRERKPTLIWTDSFPSRLHTRWVFAS